MNKQTLIAIFGFIILTGCTGTVPKLGVDSGQLMACPDKPNCVNSQTADDEHFITPLIFKGTSQQAQKRLLQVLQSMQQTTVITANEGYIRVEFTSKVFKFVDDAEFTLLASENGKTIINVRSASRIGHSDFGVNRERIEQIRAKLAAKS